MSKHCLLSSLPVYQNACVFFFFFFRMCPSSITYFRSCIRGLSFLILYSSLCMFCRAMYTSDLQQQFLEQQHIGHSPPAFPKGTIHRIRLSGLYTADQMRVILGVVQSTCLKSGTSDSDRAAIETHGNALLVAVSAWSIGSKDVRTKRQMSLFSSLESCSQGFVMCPLDDCYVFYKSIL